MESLAESPPDVVVFDNSMRPYYSTGEGFRMLETLLRAYVQERQYERLALLDPTCDVYVAFGPGKLGAVVMHPESDTGAGQTHLNLGMNKRIPDRMNKIYKIF